jgi:Zn-dependent oligopeptidase
MAPSIPEEIVEKLNRSRNMLQGLFIKRQLVFAFFDMAVHGDRYDEPCDKLFNTIYKDITGFELDESISFPASFGHLMCGYDAGYYGYMWALVFAKDCFTSFKGREIDPVIGKRFKETVLSYGSSRPSLDSLREFLGREPSDDAFIESLFN